MENPKESEEFTESSIVVVCDHQTSVQLDDENVILDLEKGIYYGLNPVGSRIWNIIQSPNSVTEIVSKITSEYDLDRDECMDYLISFLSDLREKGLILHE